MDTARVELRLEDGTSLSIDCTAVELSLIHIFSGGFTNHHDFNVTLKWATHDEIASLPPLPKEWKYVALSELGDLGRGKSKHRPRNDAVLFKDGKYPFIQTGDVKAANKYIMVCSKLYGDKETVVRCLPGHIQSYYYHDIYRLLPPSAAVYYTHLTGFSS